MNDKVKDIDFSKLNEVLDAVNENAENSIASLHCDRNTISTIVNGLCKEIYKHRQAIDDANDHVEGLKAGIERKVTYNAQLNKLNDDLVDKLKYANDTFDALRDRYTDAVGFNPGDSDKCDTCETRGKVIVKLRDEIDVKKAMLEVSSKEVTRLNKVILGNRERRHNKAYVISGLLSKAKDEIEW